MSRSVGRLAYGLGLLFALLGCANAQNAFPTPQGSSAAGAVVMCPSTANAALKVPCDATNPLATTASVSASIAGFPTTQSTGTPISVTTSGVAGTLPTGAVVVATNVGTTNGAYCKLGASATTSDQFIAPNGGWFAFTVGASTQLTCITSTSTTTVNMVGGSGLPTGTGGGGGGAAGSTAITTWAGGTLGAMANYGTAPGAVLVPGVNASVTASALPTGAATAAKQPALGTAGSSSTDVISVQGIASGTAMPVSVSNANTNGQATAANSSPVVLASNQIAADPCMFQAKTNLPISQNGTSSVQLIALSGATSIYVCSLALIAAAATTVAITTGTGTACVTGNAAVIGSTTANIANSMSFAANGGLTLGNGQGTVAKGAASSELCMILGANVFVSGNLTYVQQ